MTNTDNDTLSKKEIEQIKAEIGHYNDPSAASIEALKIIQQQRGWVSDHSLRAVAELLSMSADELDGVATFYNLIYRQPVGAQVIHYCDSVSCWLMGADQVCASLCQQLKIKVGETTADGKYTLLPIVCLGDCDHAPVMLVGDRLHRNLSPENIRQWYREHG